MFALAFVNKLVDVERGTVYVPLPYEDQDAEVPVNAAEACVVLTWSGSDYSIKRTEHVMALS